MGVEQVDFGGVKENVITRQSYPMQWARERIDGKTISILGQGPQGRGQGLNLRRNGFKVIVGQRSDSPTYQKALDDG